MSEKSTYRLIVSGGGTGGHIFPAIAIADEFKRRHPDADILFVGAEGKMEMQKVPEAGYRIEGLPITGIQRKLDKRNLAFPFKLIKSLNKAGRIVKDFKPNAVVGVGGYASGPLLYAATKRKVPALIQEQNSFAGLTNKWLKNKVGTICVAYEGMEKYFPKEKLKLTGNPVRANLAEQLPNQKEAKAFWGFDPEQPVVLSIGGSLGAKTLNESLKGHIEAFEKAGVQLLWQCGAFYHERLQQFMQEMSPKGIRLEQFIKDMPQAYAAADVIISRAGALSVSELALVGKPVIFVPSPNVAEDHQTQNAQFMVKREAAWMVRDDEARTQLVPKALELLKHVEECQKLGQNIKKQAKPNATADIVDELEKLIK